MEYLEYLKMKKIAFAAAALLAVSGSAFANGSDNYGSYGPNQPAATVDSTYTSSIQGSDTAVYKLLNTGSNSQEQAIESKRDNSGNR